MTNNIVVADAFNGVVRPLAEGERFLVTLPVQCPQSMMFVGLGRSAGNYAGVYRLPEDFHPEDCKQIYNYAGSGKVRLIGYMKIEEENDKN
jgi:hypothetical protein